MRVDESKAKPQSFAPSASTTESGQPHAVVDDASAADSVTVNPGRIQALFNKLGPAIVQQDGLQKLVVAGSTDADKIIKALKCCPVLSARVLSVANSASSGVAHEITSVERAVTLIGARYARSVAIAQGLRQLMRKLDLPEHTTQTLWQNSQMKAIAARTFCEVVEPRSADTAYTTALLSDIGLPMLMSVDQNFYAEELHDAVKVGSLLLEECEFFGADHAIVGSALLSKWGVAPPLIDAVMQHHLAPLDVELEPRRVGEWSALRLAVFFSSLLPHLDEQPGEWTDAWLRTIHARFLADHFPTVEQMLSEFSRQVERATGPGGTTMSTERKQRLTASIVSEIAADNIELVARLCQVEEALSCEQEGSADLKMQAFTDPLTKILNRHGLLSLMDRRLAAASEQKIGVCCLLVDLDEFKQVNDTFGHATGDQMLRGLAKLLRGVLPKQAVFGRLGGDEFAAVITGLSEAEARDVSTAVGTGVSGHKVRVAPELELTLHASVGAVYFPIWPSDAANDLLLRTADQAMYHRKKNGKNGVYFTLGQTETSTTLIPGHKPVTRVLPRPMPKPISVMPVVRKAG